MFCDETYVSFCLDSVRSRRVLRVLQCNVRCTGEAFSHAIPPPHRSRRRFIALCMSLSLSLFFLMSGDTNDRSRSTLSMWAECAVSSDKHSTHTHALICWIYFLLLSVWRWHCFLCVACRLECIRCRHSLSLTRILRWLRHLRCSVPIACECERRQLAVASKQCTDRCMSHRRLSYVCENARAHVWSKEQRVLMIKKSDARILCIHSWYNQSCALI